MKKKIGVFALMFSLLMCFTCVTACVKTDEAKVELEKIVITTNPSKTAYFEGESFDKAGMVVTATFTDKSTKVVTDKVTAPTDPLVVGQTTLAISFTDGGITKSANVAISVAAEVYGVLEAIEITSAPTKTTYFVGEMFDKAGMVVKASFDSKKTKIVTSSVVVPSTAIAEGQTSVVVSYTDGTVTKTADVAITIIPKITITTSSLVIEAGATGKKATASFYAEYKATSLDITSIVVDSSLVTVDNNVYASDNIEMYLNKVKREVGIADGTLHVTVTASGKTLIKKYIATDGEYSTVTDSGVVALATRFSLDNKVVDGYKIVTSIPYTALGITEADKNAAIVAGLTNSVINGDPVTEYSTKFGENYEQAHTYAAVKGGNMFEKNEWFQLGKAFGSIGTLRASSSWDISEDDGINNKIVMTKTDGDNNIFMHQINSTSLYAKASFTAKQLYNGEKFAKFGLSVTTQSGNGFMFYIENSSADGIKMTGTGLGYAKKANHQWTSFGGVGSIGNDPLAYQGAKSVELAIYRQNKAFVLYCNGVKVSTVSGISETDATAHVGIVSFNTQLEVTKYSITDDKTILDPMKIVQVEKDYLFMGDSYTDKWFWNTYDAQFSDINAVNMGVGGTMVNYWTDMLDVVKTLYNPKKITVHIGINDINNNATVAAVIENLKTMFTRYKEEFPGVEIYYISLNPNDFIVANWAKCQEVNTAIKEYIGADQKLHYIDFATTLGNKAGADVAKYFSGDGLHLNADGYALWNRDIKLALGLPAGVITDYGFGEAGGFTNSAAWVKKDGYIENIGGGESALYIDGVNHTEFYAETNITVMGKNNTDAWPKVGISLKGTSGQMYLYIDAADVAGGINNKWGSVVTRTNKTDWNWGGFNFANYDAVYSGGTYAKMSVAKTGDKVYFYVNDKLFFTEKSIFAEDELISVNVLNHNLNARAKDASGITEEAALKAKFDMLGIAKSTESKTIDGDLKDWTAKEKEGKWVVPATGGRSVTAYAVMKDDGVYIAYDAYHSNNPTTGDDWSVKTNIEFTLGNKDGRFVNIVNERNNIGFARFSQKKGEVLWNTIFEVFVPYVMIPGYDSTSPSIPIDFAFKSMEEGSLTGAGQWWIVEHPYLQNSNRVTRNGYNAATDKTIDGDISDWNADLKEIVILDNVVSGEDRVTAKINAYTANDGLYLYLQATTTGSFNNNVGNTVDPFKNSNIVLYVGGQTYGTEIFIFNNILTVKNLFGPDNVNRYTATAAYKLEGKTMTIEVFVPSYSIQGWNAENKTTTLSMWYCLKEFLVTTLHESKDAITITPKGITA